MAHQQDGSGNADARELVQALVEDLLVSLNVEDAPDAYANVLLQNMSQFQMPSKVLALKVKRQLAKRASDEEHFNELYGQVKDVRVLDRFLLLVSNILDDPSLTALLTVGGAAAASAPAGRTASISISSVDSYSHTDGDGDGDTDTADDGGQDADEIDLNSTGGSQAYGQLADNVRSTLTSQDGRALGSAAVAGSSGRLKLQRPSQTAAAEPSGPAPYSRAIQLPLKQNAPRAASSGAGAADAQSHSTPIRGTPARSGSTDPASASRSGTGDAARGGSVNRPSATASAAAAGAGASKYSILSPASAKQLAAISVPVKARASERSIEDRELMDLPYGVCVTLRSQTARYVCAEPSRGSGLGADSSSHDVAVVSSPHPVSAAAALLVHARSSMPPPESFVLINAKTPSDRGAIRFDDVLCIGVQQLEGQVHFLMAENDGSVSLSPVPAAGTGSSAIANRRISNIGAGGTPTGSGTTVLLGTTFSTAIAADTRARWTMCAGVSGTSASDSFEEAVPVFGTVKIFDRVCFKSCFGTLLTVEADGSVHARAQTIGSNQTLDIAKASLPFVPSWSRQRALTLTQPLRESLLAVQSGRFGSSRSSGRLNVSGSGHRAGGSLSLTSQQQQQQNTALISVLNGYPLEVQEQLLLEDLLYALMGIDGKYLHLSAEEDGSPVFKLPADFKDESITYVLSRVLPLCEHYVAVDRFVEVHSRFEYGLVNHSFCAAIRALLKEYLVLIAQLEAQFRKGKLTLQKLWFYVQPSLHTMERLRRLITACGPEAAAAAAAGSGGAGSGSQITGGALLNVIYRTLAKEGDVTAQSLLVHLMAGASGPYFRMLEDWLYRGLIVDPYEEFQIRARDDLSKENLKEDFNDTYWEQRYTVREDKLPVFLEPLAEKILITGKYLNVIRECGRPVECPVELRGGDGPASSKQSGSSGRLAYTTDHRDYVDRIDKAYAFASHSLLELLMRDEQLLLRLKSIKRYFLLEEGDFFEHFMDIAESELKKPIADIQRSKLESLLELAVRTASSAVDPFKDDLVCYLQKYTLIQKLDAIHGTGARSLIPTLSGVNSSVYIPPSSPHGGAQGAGNGRGDVWLDDDDDDDVDDQPEDPWAESAGGPDVKPAANVGPNSSLKGHEVFSLGYKVRWPLSIVISKRSITKYQLIFRHLFHCKHVERQLCATWVNHQSTKELNLRAPFATSYCLRQRMMHFLQNFMYYIMVEVIEPNWHQLETQLKTVSTVDEVLRYHNAFLDKCLKECLLTNQHLLKLFSKLMVTCSLFAEFIARFTKSSRIEATEYANRLDQERERERAAVRATNSGGGVASADIDGKDASDSFQFQRRKTKIKVESAHVTDMIAQKNYVQLVRNFEENFDSKLRDFLRQLRDKSSMQYDHHLANLFTRLDYNGYYSHYFGTEVDSGSNLLASPTQQLKAPQFVPSTGVALLNTNVSLGASARAGRG